MGKEKYNKEELIRLLIHEGKSYKEVAAMRGDGSTGEAIRKAAIRRKGSNLYKNTHNGFDFKSRLRSGNILSEFNRNYGNPNAAMSEMSKVTDYTSKNAPITLFQDAEEVARFKITGNKKRLIDYMKFTDRLHNR